MTQPTDIEAIAAELSEAQRHEIANATDCHSIHGGYPFLTVELTGEPWPQGVCQFLTLKSDRLTPLGLALRNHLIERNGDE